MNMKFFKWIFENNLDKNYELPNLFKEGTVGWLINNLKKFDLNEEVVLSKMIIVDNYQQSRLVIIKDIQRLGTGEIFLY